LLSLAAASDISNVTHMSLGRLSERMGVSRGHLARQLRKDASHVSKFCSIEEVPGRASKWVFRPSLWRPDEENTQRAGAPGVARRRSRGGAPALHVSSTTSGQLPSGHPPTDPKGPAAGLDPDKAEQERQLLIALRRLREST